MTVRAVAPDSVISSVNDESALAIALEQKPDLLMVNRQLDGDFTTFSGTELITRSRRTHPEVPLMLISNYADAQAQAVAAGAVPGFGKSDLSTSRARQALASILVHPTL